MFWCRNVMLREWVALDFSDVSVCLILSLPAAAGMTVGCHRCKLLSDAKNTCSHIYTVRSTGLNGASDLNGLSCRAGFAGVWVTEELRRSKAADISSDAAVRKRCTMINYEPRLFGGIVWVWNWVPRPKAVLFNLLFIAYHYHEQIIYPYHQLLKMWMTNSL
jgi:hypothetical protein